MRSAPLASQPGELGEPVDLPAPRPLDRAPISGRYVSLAPIDPERDAERLYAVSRPPEIWRYLFDGPYESSAKLRVSLERQATSEDPFFYTVLRDGDPQGIVSYLRITPEHGVIEIGNIWFGVPLQRTTAATEVIYLLARHAFDVLGYRRLEWKCNALNTASRRAAERFGFVFEGVFEQHMVVKGRNRDTAWYAVTDRRWPALRAAFEAWLSPSNFDGAGRQRRSLEDLRA
ncbi:MAG TPA: GNAT family protein [Solirubrobacteraceae bacterium]|nr:GNAT family protein [Solirubrobacteraceae bacterium]